ncbi:hypothetical protein E8E12_009651 [Didymella heteroderae]|uniref:Uncharacterized protein n=1 Tax=Didymella heteroderae TaxID=1769908 RepID=A0A9P4WTV1_9PLEO|nr:hypothetical protein E8E12_009651 [Didymella heteroderae]
MPSYSSFTTKTWVSYSQVAAASSAPTPSIMNSASLLRNSNPRSTSAAQAVVSFVYDGAQLPEYLARYAGFFAGFVTGMLSGSVLYAYVHRNQCDRAKVKLAVFHILHVIQQDYSYNALLQNPQELPKRIETEVMRLVNKHLTQDEVTQVTKEVKRSFSHISFNELVHKSVRENVRSAVKKRQGPSLAAPYQKSIRGFLDPTIAEQAYEGYVPGPATTSRIDYKSPFDAPDRCDSPLQAPDEAIARAKLGLGHDQMDIDKAARSSCSTPYVLEHLFSGSSRPAARLPATTSAHQSIFVGRVDTSTSTLDEEDEGHEGDVNIAAPFVPAERATQVAESLQEAGRTWSPCHAPELGSFGLDYDGDVYSSDEEKTLQTDGPPPVVRKCDRVKCSGTQLSPVPGSPWRIEDLPAALSLSGWSTKAELEYSSSESESEKTPPTSLAVNMSTEPELEYSSSEHGSDAAAPASSGAATTPSRSPTASPEPLVAAPTQEEAGCPQTPSSEVSQENLAPSPPSHKRKSALPSPSSPSKRTRTSLSPLADITNGPSTPPRCTSPPPTKEPLKKGRGRGRISKAAPTPGRRQSKRLQEKKDK